MAAGLPGSGAVTASALRCVCGWLCRQPEAWSKHGSETAAKFAYATLDESVTAFVERRIDARLQEVRSGGGAAVCVGGGAVVAVGGGDGGW